MKHTKKSVSVVLAFMMIFTVVLPGIPAVSAKTIGNETIITPIDPSTLGVSKLGATDGATEAETLKPVHSASDIVRVSIFLDSASTMDAGYSAQNIASNSDAVSYRDSLKKQQEAVTADIEKAIGGTLQVKWNLTLAVNAISANVKYGDIAKIAATAGVKSVELENCYSAPVVVDSNNTANPLTANTSQNMVGATAAWLQGYTGAGSKIAVIDTGIDTTHQSFGADAFNHAIAEAEAEDELMTASYVSGLVGQLNSRRANYVSAKIPYAYNYCDNNTTVNHLSDTQGEHGSHVAGIASANRYIKSGQNYNDAISTVSAVGMAPDAQLLIMKVFGAAGGAYDSDYFAAIEDAFVLGADAINLSLGSTDPGWTYDTSYQAVLNRFVNEDSVVAMAAGNAGAFADNLRNDLYIDDVYMNAVGSPGSYVNSMGVASADNNSSASGVAAGNADISYFSSWGVAGSLVMKPEITAPGGNIYSVFGTNRGYGYTTGGPDKYEYMSGTSMATPHIAGLTAALAEFIRENNLTEKTGYTQRQLAQSLLMSTAIPLHDRYEGGAYYPILQQGAGLANVGIAVNATSFIMMDDNANISAADGKVKVELGDDPAKTGVYTYSFTINNLSDFDKTYKVSTDLFTQDNYKTGGVTYMDYATTDLDVDETVIWETAVDLGGKTNALDAVAILGTNGENLDDGVVPANGSRKVTVVLKLTDAQKDELDKIYTSGAYIEGFTYVTCTSETDDGDAMDVQHSIPILGFYSSWTDPSMFDNTSYVDTIYGTAKTAYSGKTDTNYMTLTENGSAYKFSGNPYKVEKEFPADRLALNPDATVRSITYNLIRSAGSTGFAASLLNDRHEVVNVLGAAVNSSYVVGQYYDDYYYMWSNTQSRTYNANKKVSDYGVKNGDLIRLGFYAVPEYNAMQMAQDITSSTAGRLSNDSFSELLKANVLGDGAYVGYDFVIDNQSPSINASINEDKTEITVTVTDNENIAYFSAMSIDGSTVYFEDVPAAGEYTAVIPTEGIDGYVALFVGDYAGNENAVSVKVNDNTEITRTYYVLTNTLEAGKNYLIVSSNSAGARYALGHSGTTVASDAVTVKAADSTFGSAYIESKDVDSTSVWTAGSGTTLKNGNYYLGISSSGSSGSLRISTSATNWTWSGSTNRLSSTSGGRTYYLRYQNGFSVSTSAASIYLYVKTTVQEHSFGTPVYKWADDNSTVTATAVCENDSTHVVTETVKTSYAVTKPATCEENGKGVYTAEFENELFSTQTKEVVLKATDHEYETEYKWAENNSTATATAVCANDPTHVVTETVNTSYEVTTPATCEEDGVGLYTARFMNELFSTQTKEIAIAATGHVYGEPEYEWAEDNSTVTATAVCENDPEHVVTETVDTSYEVITPPTSVSVGRAVYTAEFENELFSTQTKNVVLNKLAPDYELVNFIWNTDNGVTAVAVFIDHNNNDAILEFPAGVTSVNEKGFIVYTATVTLNEVTYTDTLTVPVEAEIMLGDVNLDGEITAEDARLALRRAVDLEDFAKDSEQYLSADVNFDGKITAEDARSILRAAVDLEDPADWIANKPE